MCCSKDIYSEKEDPLDEAGRQGTYRKYGNEQEAPRCLRIRERRQQESLGLRYANPAYNPSRQGSASSMACNLELALADNYMRQNAMPDWSSSSSSGGGGGRRNNMATQRPSPPGSGENTPPLASVSSATISVWSFIQDPQPGTSAAAIAKMKEMKEKAVEVLREPNNIQYADDDDEDDEDEIVEIMV